MSTDQEAVAKLACESAESQSCRRSVVQGPDILSAPCSFQLRIAFRLRFASQRQQVDELQYKTASANACGVPVSVIPQRIVIHRQAATRAEVESHPRVPLILSAGNARICRWPAKEGVDGAPRNSQGTAKPRRLA